MVDVIRTPSELLNTLFPDGQPAGSITPQDIRDLVVTMFAGTGWGNYQDVSRTSGSPQSIPANIDTVVLNDAGSKQEQELPPDAVAAGGFYDSASNKILGINGGDAKLITTEFFIRRASGNGAFTMKTFFDIGGSVGALYDRTANLPGTGDLKITFTTGVYTLDTWQANGAEFKINTSVATEIWGVRYVLHRIHRGFGTYPPP